MLRLKPYAPYRDFRRGCCGCWLLLLLFLLLMLSITCLLGLWLGRWFTPTAHAASDGERQVVRLAPAIPAAPYRATAYGVFFTNRVTVEVAPGSVLISSTPDGTGQIMTDDQVIIQVVRADGSMSEWAHDFRAGNRPGVVPLAPQNIASLFRPGMNTVTIRLVDLSPDTYSSLPYYLIFTPPLTKTPTVLPSMATTATRNASPTATRVISSPLSVETTTPTDVAAPTLIASVPTPAAANADPERQSDLPDGIILGSATLGVVLIAGALARWVIGVRHNQVPKANQPPQMFGWIDVYDSRTHESQPALDLSRWGQGVFIHLDPLRLTPATDATPPNTPSPCVVAIRSTDDGILLLPNNVPVMSGLGWEDQLELINSLEGAGYILRDGMRLVIDGRLELEYRNPRQSVQGSETWMV